MKINKICALVTVGLLGTLTMNAQNDLYGNIQNIIPKGKQGINVFDVKKDSAEYKGLSVKLGGDFSMQFQGLSHEHKDNPLNKPLADITNNFNLPSANMQIDAQLFDGVRMNIDVYLSTRHHNETWVKGGYLQIDKLDFIQKGFLESFMKYATIKAGQMENNYGDAHFRRSDAGSIMKNAFVGNNLMDSFTTEMGIELYYNRANFIGMLGATNAKLSQSVQASDNPSPAIIAKLGYDKQINNDLRVRLTGSIYHCADVSTPRLYNADRAGSRFYEVMIDAAYLKANGLTKTQTSGQLNPGFARNITSFMINPFIKYQGFEFFGTYENTTGANTAIDTKSRSWNQYAAEVLYRFGAKENLYVGGKYNMVTGKLNNNDVDKIKVQRIEAGLGWFMTKNIVTKAMYVNQDYSGYTPSSNNYEGKFNGYMIEAGISF